MMFVQRIASRNAAESEHKKTGSIDNCPLKNVQRLNDDRIILFASGAL